MRCCSPSAISAALSVGSSIAAKLAAAVRSPSAATPTLDDSAHNFRQRAFANMTPPGERRRYTLNRAMVPCNRPDRHRRLSRRPVRARHARVAPHRERERLPPRRPAPRVDARGVLDLRDLVRRRDRRRRRRQDLLERAIGRLRRSVRLRALPNRARSRRRRAVVAAAVHDVRRLVSRPLLAVSSGSPCS